MDKPYQISMYDVCPELIPHPPLWECMATCKHAGEHTDHFPGRPDLVRCVYGLFQPGIGDSGKDLYEKVENNIVSIYCVFYEWKGGM